MQNDVLYGKHLRQHCVGVDDVFFRRLDDVLLRRLDDVRGDQRGANSSTRRLRSGRTATIDENRRLDDAVRAVQDAEHAAVLHSDGEWRRD